MAEIKMDKANKESKGLIKWAVVDERQVPLWELFNRVLRGTRRSKVKASSTPQQSQANSDGTTDRTSSSPASVKCVNEAELSTSLPEFQWTKKEQSPKKLYVTKTSIVQHRQSSYLTEELGDKTPTKPVTHSESIECIFSTMSFRKPKLDSRDSTSHGDTSVPRQVEETGHWELHSYPSSDSDDAASASKAKPAASSVKPGKDEGTQIVRKPDIARFGSFIYVSCFGNGSQVSEDEEKSPLNSPNSNAASTPKLAKLTTSVHVADIMSEQPQDYSTFLKAYDELLARSHQLEKQIKEELLEERTKIRPSETTDDSAVLASTLQHPTSALPDPSLWPQYPLALRATPNSGMKVLGVRYSSATEYLPEPWCSVVSSNNIRHRNGERLPTKSELLPINSGFEPPGKSLVIDFETEFFIGTLMLRIKDAFNLMAGNNNITNSNDVSANNYFGSMNRKYQAVIRGEFKQCIPVIHTVTGQVFPSPVLHLPSRWVLKSAVSVISMFAPQLQANFDGAALRNVRGPSFISPLGSTPQVVVVQEPCNDGARQKDFYHRYRADQSIESSLEEPIHEKNTLVGQYKLQCKTPKQPELSLTTQPLIRANIRKKLYDRLYSKSDESIVFTPGKVYTFEFLQHLVNFTNFTLDLSFGGNIALCDVLNGQPLRTMGAYFQVNNEVSSTQNGHIKPKNDLHYLWSFDIWHQGLYKDYVSNIANQPN
jgi:hypothetical protein